LFVSVLVGKMAGKRSSYRHQTLGIDRQRLTDQIAPPIGYEQNSAKFTSLHDRKCREVAPPGEDGQGVL